MRQSPAASFGTSAAPRLLRPLLVACADDRRPGARPNPRRHCWRRDRPRQSGWSATDTSRATSANELEFSARAGAATDYIYRGTTLSDHGPAAGAAFEARFGQLYAGTTVATVKLPTQPAADSPLQAESGRRSQPSISISA